MAVSNALSEPEKDFHLEIKFGSISMTLSNALFEAEKALHLERKFGPIVTTEQCLFAFKLSDEYEPDVENRCKNFLEVYPELKCRAQRHFPGGNATWRLTEEDGEYPKSWFMFIGPSILEVESIMDRADLDRTLMHAPVESTKKKGGRL